MTPKKIIAKTLFGTLILAVAIFTGMLSFGFWSWTFPPELWYYAVLGFGLTGGGAVVYLVEFSWEDDLSDLRRTLALVMMIICTLGEIFTAGYGIKLEILTRTAVIPTQNDFRFMTVVVQVLILLHFVSLIIYFAGDRIVEMFESASGKDINKDGTIGKKNKVSNTNHTIDDYLDKIGMDYEEAQAHWRGKKYSDFAQEANQKFDRITSGNMKAIWGELVGSANPQTAARNNGKNP